MCPEAVASSIHAVRIRIGQPGLRRLSTSGYEAWGPFLQSPPSARSPSALCSAGNPILAASITSSSVVRLFSCSASTPSSIVPGMTGTSTRTSRFWPRRQARSSAWRIRAGVQGMDAKATMFAAVSVVPTPAAIVVPMNTLIPGTAGRPHAPAPHALIVTDHPVTAMQRGHAVIAQHADDCIGVDHLDLALPVQPQRGWTNDEDTLLACSKAAGHHGLAALAQAHVVTHAGTRLAQHEGNTLRLVVPQHASGLQSSKRDLVVLQILLR